jgi:hypothetical protein
VNLPDDRPPCTFPGCEDPRTHDVFMGSPTEITQPDLWQHYCRDCAESRVLGEMRWPTGRQIVIRLAR